MSSLPHEVTPHGGISSGTNENVVHTASPVFIMVPTQASVKQKTNYGKMFPKSVMIFLSSIQIIMAFLGIITNIVGLSVNSSSAHYVGAGIWCGVFFGLSGSFGVMASLKPSNCTIVTFMVFTVISATFCLPLLVISSIGASVEAPASRYNYRRSGVLHAMYAMQIVVSLIQAIAAIVSAAMACRAVCNCCRPKEKNGGAVYYSNHNTNGMNNIALKQFMTPQLESGQITIPMTMIQPSASVGGDMALPTENLLNANPKTNANTPPPEYEVLSDIDYKRQEIDGSKYQRF